MAGFSFGATMVRVIDGDTALVDPQVFPQDTLLRVRFKDVFAPEGGESGAAEAKHAAEAMFPQGSRVVLTNTRARWTFNRLEARVDREDDAG